MVNVVRQESGLPGNAKTTVPEEVFPTSKGLPGRILTLWNSVFMPSSQSTAGT
ncbi:hypothetical protein D3C85_1851140 [compost metagenome]